LVPEDRKDQGVAQIMTVQDNLMMPSLYNMGPFLGFRQMKEVAKELVRKLRVKGHLEQITATLSGGNQQKIVIAKWLPLNPKVLIFDEPTRGIDVGARASVYQTIRELAESGVGVIVISSELPEVLGLSNRILVMNKGRQTGVLDRSEATEHAVMTLAVR
jgi:ribose transport system ATP-binding protein